jgi:hypothetical protein
MQARFVASTTVTRTSVCILCVFINLAVSSFSAAAVFTPSVSVSNSPYFPPPNNQPGFEIRAWLQPNVDDLFNDADLWVTITSNLVLSPYSQILDPGASWYSVTNGTVLNPAFRSAATPFANNFGSLSSDQIPLAVGQDFYLGFYVQIPDIGLHDLYGWAHFQLANPSSLTLLGSATENGGLGIIVGTPAAVPEPSALWLATLAVVLLTLFSRTSRLSPTPPLPRRPRSVIRVNSDQSDQVVIRANTRHLTEWKVDR